MGSKSAIQSFLLRTVLTLTLIIFSCTVQQTKPLTAETLFNTSYNSEWAENGMVKLTGGTYQEISAHGSAAELVISNYPDMYAFGDLNGDKIADAVIILATAPGGSGTFISLEALININGSPVHWATELLGDRVKIKSIKIESGLVIVAMITHAAGDPLCCPSQDVITSYKLSGKELIKINQ